MARVTRMTKRRLGELLLAEGLISEEQMTAALEEQRKSNVFLSEALVKLGVITEEMIAYTLVQQFSLPFISALQYSIPKTVFTLFPERMYFEYQFIAADKIDRVLLIVGAGLMNHDVLDELERLSGCHVRQVVSTWKDIRAAIAKYAIEYKTDAAELTSLGTMLLEGTPLPGNLPAAPARAAAAAATAAVPAATRTPPAGLPAVAAQAVAQLKAQTSAGAETPAQAEARQIRLQNAPMSRRVDGLASVPRPAPTALVNPINVKPPPGSIPAIMQALTSVPGVLPGENEVRPILPPQTAAGAPDAAKKEHKPGAGLLGLFKK